MSCLYRTVAYKIIWPLHCVLRGAHDSCQNISIRLYVIFLKLINRFKHKTFLFVLIIY